MVFLILFISNVFAKDLIIKNNYPASTYMKYSKITIEETGVLTLPASPVVIEAQELIIHGKIQGSNLLTLNDYEIKKYTKTFNCSFTPSSGGSGDSLGRFSGGSSSLGFGGGGATNRSNGGNALFYISGDSFNTKGVSFGENGKNGIEGSGGSGGGRGLHGGFLILKVNKISGNGIIDLSGGSGGSGGSGSKIIHKIDYSCGVTKECVEHKSKEGCVKFLEIPKTCYKEEIFMGVNGGGGSGGNGGCLFSNKNLNNIKVILNGGNGGNSTNFNKGSPGKSGVLNIYE